MLLTKEVEVKIGNGGKTSKEYLKKGYLLPYYIDKKGKKRIPKDASVKIKIEDLSKNSAIKIQYECDNCHDIIETSYANYIRKIEKNDTKKTYCVHCSPKIFNSGEKHYKYNRDLTEEQRINGRTYEEYSDFHRKVLIRDNYTCQCCNYNNNSKRNLIVHHLYSYKNYEDLRTEVTNGITLCKKCHKAFHAIYGNGGNTKEQFEEWTQRKYDNLQYEGELLPTKVAYCIEDSEIIKSIPFYCREHREIKPNYIYNCCNKKRGNVFGKHYLWYDEYIEMSQNDIEKHLKWCENKSKTGTKGRPIVNLDKDELYYNMTIALQLNYPNSSNGSFFKGITERGSFLGDNWCFLEDYKGDASKLKRVGDSFE